MDINELKELLSNEEVVKLLDDDTFKDIIDNTKYMKGLRTNRDTILTESKQYKELLAAYKELGEVDSLKSAKEFYTKAEQERIAKEGESKDSVVLAQVKALQEKLAGMEKERQETLERNLRTSKEAFITKALAEAKGEPELLAHVLSKRVKADYENDEVKFTILSDKGEALADENGAKSITDVINELKTHRVYSKAFEPEVVTGANSKQSNNNKTVEGLPKKVQSFFG